MKSRKRRTDSMDPEEAVLEAADLMPLEAPVLKVSRPVAACSRCRNAKIKCDGKLPACTSCEKNGRAAECTGTNDQFARGKERSYVSTLETRIEKLQARLEEARARKASVISLPDDEHTATRRQSLQVPVPPTPRSSKAKQRQEATAIDDLVSGFGFLSVNATARDFYGFTTAMSYARLVLWACSKEALPEGMAKDLPPRYIATALIQHYLNNVLGLLPVFDEASFYASVENVYSKQARPLDHWLVRMVLAIASASKSQQRGDQCYVEAIGHVCAALDHSEDVLHPGAMSSIQALVLFTEFAMLDPHHFDSWGLIGAASRAMADLGMHQDPPKGTFMPKGKLELRRRIYYCVYALDRSTSLVQTRAFSFSDDSAKVKVPFHKEPLSTPTSPDSSASQQFWLQPHTQAFHLISLRTLQSKWYTDLFQSGRTRWEEPYPYIWATCDAMRKWFESLSPSTSSNVRAFFEMDLLYSYVYVLSPSPRVPVTSPFAQKLIFEYCIRYAELTLCLINDPAYTAPMTFYDAMRVYMTGRQFLDVLRHNLDGLLHGHVPPHPEVKPTAAPPPPMPVVPLPPGETVLRFNTARSIGCIKQITECLYRFGVRWGYLSWNQRYQSETSAMLEELNLRLRELDGSRGQSVWSGGSTSSIGSTTAAGIEYLPPSSMTASSAMYPQSVSTAFVPPITQTSPTQFSQPALSPAELEMGRYVAQAQPQYQHSLYNFNQLPSPPLSTAVPHAQRPSQQFANWAGYGGSAGQAPTLDQEIAVPPDS